VLICEEDRVAVDAWVVCNMIDDDVSYETTQNEHEWLIQTLIVTSSSNFDVPNA
jgi:type VI protein secretion system component VasF